MHRGPDGTNVNPAHDLILHPGDEFLVIAPMDALIALQTLDRPKGQAGPPDAAPPPPRTRPTGEP